MMMMWMMIPPMQTLAKIIDAHAITKFHNHELLPGSSNVIKPKSPNVVFVPKLVDKTKFELAMKTAKRSNDVALRWICESKNQKLRPIGVGLFTLKQVIAKIGGTEL